MTSCFPLYENLFNLKTKKSLNRDEKRALIENIAKLNQDGQNKIAALVLYYQTLHDLRKVIHPSQTMDINLADLPSELQVRLEIFVFKHLSYMKETDQRESAVNQIQ